jgi:hypothetical protein
MSRLKDSAAVRKIAKKSLFEGLDQIFPSEALRREKGAASAAPFLERLRA